jgi:hypothetical protein
MPWIPPQPFAEKASALGIYFGCTEEIGQSEMKKQLSGVVFSII